MKRLTSALLMFIILLVLCLPAVSFASDEQFSASQDSIPTHYEGSPSLFFESKVNSDNSITVSVILSQPINTVAFQFAIAFDESVLSYVSASSGEALSDASAPTLSHPLVGKVFCIWEALTPLCSYGELLTVTFMQIGEQEGTTTIRFDLTEDFIFADENYSLTEITTEEIEIDLIQTHTNSQNNEGDSQPSDDENPTSSPPNDAPQSGENNGITLNDNSATLVSGEQQTLSVVQETKEVTWSSSNEQVATVSEDGTITGVSEGEAIITAETLDGLEYATCMVAVDKNDADAKQKENNETNETIDLETMTAVEQSTIVPWWPFAIAAVVLAALAIAIWVKRNRQN